jgi:MOSC domain-containing protein YiiM
MNRNEKKQRGGEILAVSISQQKGERKKAIAQGILKPGFGLEGDAHAGDWHRQVSLLAIESIQKIQAKGLQVGPGDFAENITTQGLNLPVLPLGTHLLIGLEAVCEITQIGKVCHDRCAIYRQAGDCVMPREGIFVRVLKGGTIQAGDSIRVSSP